NPRGASRRPARDRVVDQQRTVRQDAALSRRELRRDERYSGSDVESRRCRQVFSGVVRPDGLHAEDGNEAGGRQAGRILVGLGLGWWLGIRRTRKIAAVGG